MTRPSSISVSSPETEKALALSTDLYLPLWLPAILRTESLPKASKRMPSMLVWMKMFCALSKPAPFQIMRLVCATP